MELSELVYLAVSRVRTITQLPRVIVHVTDTWNEIVSDVIVGNQTSLIINKVSETNNRDFDTEAEFINAL